MSSGIFSTKRSSAVSVSRLTRMLVPKPKNAFQSPATQMLRFRSSVIVTSPSSAARMRVGVRDPAEDAALRGDHLQPHRLELRKVRADAVLRHQAVVAAVVGLAHGGVDADLGGDAGHDELRDAAILENGVQIGGEEGALARLVDHRLARQRVQLGDDVVSGLAAHEDASHRARVADARSRCVRAPSWPAADRSDRGGGLRGCAAPAARCARQAASSRRFGSIVRRSCETSLPSISPKPPGSRKSRCMSMMSSAQRAGVSSNGYGSAVDQRSCEIALMNASRAATAPNTPPCIVIIFSAA